MAEAAGSNPVRGFGMPLAFLFNCYTLHSRSIAGIDMLQTLDIFAKANNMQETAEALMVKADVRVKASSLGTRSITVLQVEACKQISAAAKAYVANELAAGDFLAVLAAFAPLSGLGL